MFGLPTAESLATHLLTGQKINLPPKAFVDVRFESGFTNIELFL